MFGFDVYEGEFYVVEWFLEWYFEVYWSSGGDYVVCWFYVYILFKYGYLD